MRGDRERTPPGADRRRRGALWALLAAWGALGCAPGENGPSHVVLLSVDTLNREALRAFDPDAPALPHFDALAAGAHRFQAANTPSSWTLPAHASLLTGRLPDRLGAVHYRRDIDPGVPTLVERLREAGFQTVAFTGGGFVAGDRGFARGFERYDEHTTEDAPPLTISRDGRRDPSPDPAVFDRAIAFLTQRRDTRPLFLFLHTFLVHDYWKAPDWSTGDLPEHDDVPLHHLSVLTGDLPAGPDEWKRLRALYTAHVRRMDEHLGVLLRAFEETGMRERALLVLLSDHGEGFSPETGFRHHGGHVLPATLRVPLLVSGPGVAPGDTEERVSLLDVAPTLAEVLGLPPDAGSDGRSFADALRGEPLPAPRDLFAMEYFYYWDHGVRGMHDAVPEGPLALALRRGDLWYLRSAGKERVFALEAGWPRSERSLADPDARALRDAGAARSPALAEAPARESDPEEVERLRALGYLIESEVGGDGGSDAPP